MKQSTKDLFAIVTAAISTIVILVSILYIAGAASCQALGAETNKVTKYDWLAGCIVRLDNQFVPVKNWVVYGER